MTDFDPTENLTPFGLLAGGKRGVLKAWPHGWEFYSFRQGKWKPLDQAAWCDEIVYRGKPAPVVTSVWRNIYSDGSADRQISSREIADQGAGKLRIAVLRIDTCDGVSTAHLEVVK